MKRLLLGALLLAACFDDRDLTRPRYEPEDIDFGHSSPVQAEAEASQPVTAAPAPAAGPIVVPQITISTDAAVIAQGKDLFSQRGCVGCHKIGGGKLVGPDLKGVTARRDQEWVSKMILRPDVMVKEDETARKLLAEHLVPMPNQGINAATELPQLLAFLKSNEQ